jgi:serine protease Do
VTDEDTSNEAEEPGSETIAPAAATPATPGAAEVTAPTDPVPQTPATAAAPPEGVGTADTPQIASEPTPVGGSGATSPEAPVTEPVIPGPSWSAAAAPASAGLPPAPSWAAPAPSAAPTTAPPKSRGRFRLFAGGAVVGALVGALVAGGIVAVATNDDNGTSTTRVVERVVPAKNAPNTSVFVEPADIQGVLAKVEPSVVAITTGGASDLFGDSGSGGGAGTGFVVSADGVIVTNNHVVEGAKNEIEVSFSDGTKKKATVLGSDASIDLAVVKVDGENLPTAKLGDSSALQVGDQVIAIGNALALDGGPSVTQGIVSAVNRQIQEQNGAALYNLIQTDAAINPGNSGGPLVNSSGEVVGINTAIADPSDAQNVGFAISISSVKDAIDQLRAGESVRLPYMGVYSETLTPAMAKELGTTTQLGALIREVTGGSPADDAGIKKDDVIIQVGDTKVTSAEDVGTAVRQKSAGDKVSVTVDRKGNQQTVEVTLGVRPDSN